MADAKNVKLSEVLDRLTLAAASIPGRTEDELRRDLEDQGIDTKRLLDRIGTVVEAARLRALNEKLATAARDREEAIARLSSRTPPSRTPMERRNYFRELSKKAAAQIEYRDYESTSDDDLERMISELEFLLGRSTDEK